MPVPLKANAIITIMMNNNMKIPNMLDPEENKYIIK